MGEEESLDMIERVMLLEERIRSDVRLSKLEREYLLSLLDSGEIDGFDDDDLAARVRNDVPGPKDRSGGGAVKPE